jgi:hypothetical protein
MPRTIIVKKEASSAPAKKTAARKAAAKKTAPPTKPVEAPKRPVGRPKGSGKAQTPAASSQDAREAQEAAANPKPHPRSKFGGLTPKEIQETFGFTIGGDAFWACCYILKGGASRIDVTNELKKKLPTTTKAGNAKPVSNIVGYVLKRMAACGYVQKSTWTMVKG